MNPFDRLVQDWQADAERLRRYGAAGRATLLEQCAAELSTALAEHVDELVNLNEASAESGYSKPHLQRLVREGVLVDRAETGPTMLRRGDLPRKPGKQEEHVYPSLRTIA